MVYITNEIKEKIKLAKNTQDKATQKQLINSYNLNIRRALARNIYLDTDVANKLAFDPSLNVSYHASNNRNCTKKRVFSEGLLDNKCVVCQSDELTLDCFNCHD